MEIHSYGGLGLRRIETILLEEIMGSKKIPEGVEK